MAVPRPDPNNPASFYASVTALCDAANSTTTQLAAVQGTLTNVQAAVTSEVQGRQAALATEAQTRSAADASEAQARLRDGDAEARARAAADAAEAQARMGADAVEAQARIDGDAALAAQIAAEVTRAPPSTDRPGDGIRAFTLVSSLSALAGGADRLPSVPASAVSFAATGGLVRQPGGTILASREADPVDPGRIRAVRASVFRLSNASDPNGATVRIGLLWLDQAKNVMSVEPGVISDLVSLTNSSGRQTRSGYVSGSPGTHVTVVAPPGAAYFRRFVQNFGFDGLVGVDTLTSFDITESLIPPPVTGDALARITTLESYNAGQRLTLLEQALQSPNSETFETRSDAASSSIPATVTTVMTRGRDIYGDGRDGLYARVAGGLPAGADGFTSHDGAVWQRVVMAQDVFDSTFTPLFTQWLLERPTAQPAAAGVWWNNGGYPALS